MISLFDVLFLAALAAVVLYFYLSRNHSYWRKRGIASDKPSILFGSLGDTFLGKRVFGETFNDIYQKHPGQKVVGWFKFQTPALLLRDPELIRKVLVSDFHSFRNNDVVLDEEADPISSKNIFVLRDDEWKKSRALITPAFTAGKIKAIYPIMTEVAKEFVQYLKDHPEELHVKDEMSRYTSEIVARCAFGIQGNNFKDSKPEMHELGKVFFEPGKTKSLKMLIFTFLPKVAKMLHLKFVPDKVVDFFNAVLRDVIVYRQANNVERNDLVQYLIEVKRKSLEVAKGNVESEIITKPYSDDDILAGCIMFFIEGYETSAVVLNNILYHLALHQDVQANLRDEVDSVLSEGELTFDRLQEMSYLNAVCLESNRVLPVSYTMQKVCMEKYEMDVGTEKPLIVEEGTPVYIPVFAVQTDPAHWEDSLSFKPERFANKEEAKAKAKGIYIPFGDGPRMCPGYRIGMVLIKLALAHIISNLEVLPTSRTPEKIVPDPNYFMIGHKGGIYLKFVPRSSK